MGNLFKTIATVEEIGEIIQIRRTSKPNLFKRVVTLKTDDLQIFYPEIRNLGLKILEREGIEIGSKVEVEFTFQGTEKDGKKYNNILIQNIRLV